MRNRSGNLGEAHTPIRVVRGDKIIVTRETGFRAAYCKRPNEPLNPRIQELLHCTTGGIARWCAFGRECATGQYS
jgi:hypothetical protein